MPRAVILNTWSKANTSGGAFADALTANSGDSLTVQQFQSGTARIVEMWSIDSDSVAEFELIYTKPAATHDTTNGFRWMNPAVALGGAAKNAAFSVLPGRGQIEVFSNDTATVNVTSTAADDVGVSSLFEYDTDSVPPMILATWDQVQSLRASSLGVYSAAVGSSTPLAYGAKRALTTDDNRFQTGTWYAILGATVQTQVTTVALSGPETSSQRIGLPAGALDLNSGMWFVEQSVKWGGAWIPCFPAGNAPLWNVEVADGEASTTPKIDFNMYQLTSRPGV